jgi:hypothetical protein
MLGRLLGALFGAKATFLSGALLVAGALVSSPVPGTDASRDGDVSPEIVAALVSLAPEALPAQAPEPARRPEPTRTPEPAPASSPAACVADQQVRAASLETIRAAFATSHAALDQLGAERSGSKATAALDHADTMLASVDRTAEDLVTARASCAADVREVAVRAVHAMDMIVDLAKSATAPTPTPKPTFRKPEPTKKHR